MSARTIEADRAIREAWKKERELVLQGKGTRQWTPEQQEDIYKTGKAHDENGYAFEGHHMLSVAKDPDMQGDPRNIQFLSKTEHLDAHGGSYQNLTNGYYDPFTGKTREFGEEGFEPCTVIELSDPVIVFENGQKDQAEPSVQKDKITKPDPPKTRTPSIRDKITKKIDGLVDRIIDLDDHLHSPEFKEDVKEAGRKVLKELKINGLKVLVETWDSFLEGNKEKNIDAPDNTISTGYGEYRSSDYYYSSGEHGYHEGGESYSYNSDDQQADEEFVDNDTANNSGEDALPKEKNYPEERESPIEHTVSGYDRVVKGKRVHVEPYKRGGKKKKEKSQEESND